MEEVLGYRLVFQPNGGIMVTSGYDPEVGYVLRPSDGHMQLVSVGENGVLGKDIHAMIDRWVRDRSSLPSFFSAITLECFDRTLGQKYGWAVAH